MLGVLLSSAQSAPSGLKIAFVKSNEIFVMADGSLPLQVTHDGIPKYLPVWSKDGSKIAFNRDTDSKRALSELVVIDESGHQIDDVLVRPTDEAPPEGLKYVESMEWLSNSKIAISGTQNIDLVETVIINLKNGTEVLNILSNAGEEAVFSPDGSHVANKDGTPLFSPE
jgi:Tol biopolymer transport system component